MIEIPYSVKIIDDPTTDLVVILAKSHYQGKPFNSIKSISRTELKEALLGEHRYNIIAWTINRLTKEIRRLLEHEVINPVLHLEQIYLPHGWSSYNGPDSLLKQKDIDNGVQRSTETERIQQAVLPTEPGQIRTKA